MLRAHERQPADSKRRLIDEVTRMAREEFPRRREIQPGGGSHRLLRAAHEPDREHARAISGSTFGVATAGDLR